MEGLKNNVYYKRLLQLFSAQQFLLALGGMILLAWWRPALGAIHAAGFLEKASFWGVCLTFFLYGLKLSPEQWKSGMRNGRLHLLVQSTTFLLFPALALLIRPFFDAAGSDMWLAVFFLCALPSTVSSSVVMVSMAKGNVPGAILNAGVSSLAGIFITPLLVSVFIAEGKDFQGGDIFLKLIYQVLVPVIIGQSLHSFGGAWAKRNAKWLKWCDQTVILLIVFSSFSHSFYDQVFSGLPGTHILFLMAGMAVLFLLIYFLIGWIARKMNFSRADTITAQFCGSKKSLVHGTVMSQVLFPSSAQAGLFLLPVMMYHAIQLVMAGYIAQRKAVEEDVE